MTKPGTNAFRGSALRLLPGRQPDVEGLLREAERASPRPTRSYQRWGGTVGGPIVKDKIHFFGSLERFAIDRPNTINIPARPGFERHRRSPRIACGTPSSAATTRSTRTTPTACAGCARRRRRPTRSSRRHQRHAGGRARGIGRRPDAVGQRQLACCRNTKVNTLRLTWTRENVAFANACFNGNGRDMTQCPADAGVPGLHRPAGQHRAGAHQRRHPARGDAGVVPARQARRPRHQVRRAVPVLGRLQHQPGQPERHVLVRPQQRAVQRGDPVDLPGPLHRSASAGRAAFYEKAHYLAGFAQDKWRMNNHVTLSLGAALRPRDHPDPGDRRPARRRRTRSTRTTSRRGSASPTTSTAARASIRAGYGRFFDKTHFELIGGLYTGTPFTTSFIVNFPTAAADLGPRNGQLPTDPFLVNGPVHQPRAARPAVPGRPAAAQHRRDLGQPRSPHAVHRRDHDRLRARSSARIWR